MKKKRELEKTRVRSEVFARQTIQDTLDGIDLANQNLANQLKNIPGVAVYRKGFWAAISAVAEVIGTGRKGGKR